MIQDDLYRLLTETFLADVEHHATLASTNDRAAELAKQTGIELPLLVITDRQTAGRGQGRNRWWSDEGSLTFSILFDPALSTTIPPRRGSTGIVRNAAECSAEEPAATAERQSDTPLISLAAALAVLESIRPLLENLDSREIGLHWPNDVFAADRKLAGILIEVLPDRKTVLGIGVNVNNLAVTAPAELQSAATTLFDLTGTNHDRTAILISVLNHLRHYLKLMKSSPEELALAADAACLQKGRRLKLQWGPTVYCGICRGIDPSGAILLEIGERLRAFPAGVILKS